MKCLKCNKELPSEAKICPACGEKVLTKKEWAVGCLTMLFVAFGVYYFFFSSEPNKEVIPEKSATVVEQKVEAQEPVQEKQEEEKVESVPIQETEPIVSETAIKMVCDTMKQHTLISDIAINVEKDKQNINIAIIANAAIKPEVAKEYGEDAARMLATFSSNADKPSKDFIGGLYNEYDLHIGIFTSGKKAITRGTKLKGLPKLTWR